MSDSSSASSVDATRLSLSKDGFERTDSLDMSNDPVMCIACSSGGTTLASGTLRGNIGLWNIDNLERIATLRGHDERVWSVAFSQGDASLASGGWDGQTLLWKVATGERIRAFKKHSMPVWCVKFMSAGQVLLSASEDGYIYAFNVADGQHLVSLGTGRIDAVVAVAVSPTGQTIIDGCLNGLVRFWGTSPVDTLDMQLEKVQRYEADRQRQLHLQRDTQVELRKQRSLQEDMKRQFLGHDSGPDLSGDDALERIKLKVLNEPEMSHLEHTQAVSALCFSPDGTQLASASHDGTVILWNPDTGEVLSRLESARSAAIWSTVFSSDGQVLAMGTGRGALDLWDTSESKLLLSVRAHDRDLYTCAFSKDSKVLLTSGVDGFMNRWRMADTDILLALQREAEKLRKRRRKLRALRKAAFDKSSDESGGSQPVSQEPSPAKKPTKPSKPWHRREWEPSEPQPERQAPAVRPIALELQSPTDEELSEEDRMRNEALTSLLMVKFQDRQRQHANVNSLKDQKVLLEEELMRLRRREIERAAKRANRQLHGLPLTGLDEPTRDEKYVHAIEQRLSYLYDKLSLKPSGDNRSFLPIHELHPEDLELQYELEQRLEQGQPRHRFKLPAQIY